MPVSFKENLTSSILEPEVNDLWSTESLDWPISGGEGPHLYHSRAAISFAHAAAQWLGEAAMAARS